jgi:formylglycine-generating enzyme required for sulfatase activity
MAERNASVTFDPGTAPVDQPLRLLRWRSRTQAFVERLDGLELTMLRIPAGRFLMGSPEGELEREANEAPVHEVSLGEFLMARTPITQAQWRVVASWEPRPEKGEIWGRELNPDPSRFQGQEARLLGGEANTDQRPVERVNWYEAMEFCSRLSQRTGRTYTLPSEAQWEYACLSGSRTPFAFGETITNALANYRGTSTYGDGPKGESRQQQTTPVGSFPANAWGLQDMHGNVWEWCLDTWHDSYEGAPEDGSAWLDPEAEEDTRRLLRGGSWYFFPWYSRASSRLHFDPGVGFNVGFRVVCLPQHPSASEPLEGIPAGAQEGSRPAPVIGRLRPPIRTAPGGAPLAPGPMPSATGDAPLFPLP